MCLRGPILFTAPHSTKIVRGGSEIGDKPRIHYREKYASALALKLALGIEKYTKKKGSFCIWNKEKKFCDTDLDPNYLL